jgi:hypothetical protein
MDQERIQNARNTCHVALKDLTTTLYNQDQRQLKFGNILLSLHSISKTMRRQSVFKLFFSHDLKYNSIGSFLRERLLKKGAIAQMLKQEDMNEFNKNNGQIMNRQHVSLLPPPMNPFFNLDYLRAMNSTSSSSSNNAMGRGFNFMNLFKNDFNSFRNVNSISLTDCMANDIK